MDDYARYLAGIYRLGEIDGETVVINSCDGTRRQSGEMPDCGKPLRQRPHENQFQIQLGDPVGQP